MAHLPTTVRGVLLTLLYLAVAIPPLVWLAITLSGPVAWITVALVAIAVIAFFVQRRRLEAARERAHVGAFSFGDVNRRIHAEEALAVAGRENAREMGSSATRRPEPARV